MLVAVLISLIVGWVLGYLSHAAVYKKAQAVLAESSKLGQDVLKKL